MFNWFKKKEYVHKELCIPKILINNGIDFNYEYVVEVASIEVKNASTKNNAIQAVKNFDIDYFVEIPTAYSKKELIKVYTLNGIDNNKKLILAIVDEAKSKKDPYLLAKQIMKVNPKPLADVVNKKSKIAY